MDVIALPGRVVRSARRAAHGVSYRHRPTLANAWSQAATYAQVTSPEYIDWCARLGLEPVHHRKRWEWVYILQVLEEHDMLQPGRTGLGFGVGKEPIAAYAALRGAHVLATDLPSDEERVAEWQRTNEHATVVADLNASVICPPATFNANVSFRPIDMRAIPDDLGTFDFVWSSCAMEHLGSLDAGLDFFHRQIAFLKPGGIGVHTTEYRVDPHAETLSSGLTVLYQRPHLEQLTYDVRKLGHHMRTTFMLGDAPEDLHVDEWPYTPTHIRTETLGYVHPSFGLWMQRRR